ncbi:hypothetical protein [Actinoplanes sp. NPDC049265]|uniref:hypothetical protein n=1 Tax=Actinoplanes sp. NPDC049265 TaxID=3363902 RepID=UPI003710134A
MIDEALAGGGPAPETPAYDRLTGGREARGWTRLKTLLEPVTLFWLIVIGAGGTVMGAAAGKTWDDTVWMTGSLLVLLGLAASLLHILRAAVRMIPPVTHPTDHDLARALLADLRRDWRRRTVFRFTDVPQKLPLLLVGTAPGAPMPPLLRAYRRRRVWLSPIVAVFRRPSAVFVTDYKDPARRPRCRWRVSLWSLVQGARWVMGTVILPRRARQRAAHLLFYGLTALLMTGLVYVHHSVDQPYCLTGTGTDDVDVEHDEWIGSRTCLGWKDLGRDVRDAVPGWIESRVTVHKPGPDDNAGLFDVNLIYRENKRVGQAAAGSSRGVVTVALVTSLTTSSPTRPIRSTVAEHEGLAGAYAAQVRINAGRDQRMPYVQLAIVNSGDLTGGADQAAVGEHLFRMRRSLHELALDTDRRLIAAVVTLNSTTEVRKALHESLGRDGIAMLSPTMTADGFGDEIRVPAEAPGAGRPVFFSVNTVNDDQVEVITRYAAGSAKKLVYYYPVDPDRIAPGFDTTDLYLGTLTCDVWKRAGFRPEALHDATAWNPSGGSPANLCPGAAAAGTDRQVAAAGRTRRPGATAGTKRGASIGLWPWSRGEPAEELRKSACPASAGSAERPQVLFFGGRYTDVAAFTELVQVACPKRPEVAVADSATRFLADGELAGLVPHRTSVLITSRGPVLTCESLTHPDSVRGLGPHDAGRLEDFADDVHNVLQRCRGAGDPEADRRLAGGWAILSYDTVLMIRDVLLRIGLTDLRRPPPPIIRTDASTPAGAPRGLLDAPRLHDLVLGCLQGRPPAVVGTRVDGTANGSVGTACTSRTFAGAYGTIELVGGVGRRTVVLLDIPDLATAFASGAGRPTRSCVPSAKPPGRPCRVRKLGYTAD